MNIPNYSETPVFTVANVDIQIVRKQKNHSYTFKEGRNKHAFLCTVKKSIRYAVHDEEKTTITADEGELVFIPQGCVYTSTCLEDDTVIKIVPFDIVDGALPVYLEKPTKIRFPDASEKIRPFFTRVEGSLPTNRFYYLSCIYTLLWHIDECHSEIPAKYRKLRPALEELSRKCEENMPISYYASLCDMSEVNFRRLFKEYTARPPIEYRNDLRLSRAQAILQSKELNVAETAESCGFSNLSFFIRLYKKHFGHTPKKE